MRSSQVILDFERKTVQSVETTVSREVDLNDFLDNLRNTGVVHLPDIPHGCVKYKSSGDYQFWAIFREASIQKQSCKFYISGWAEFGPVDIAMPDRLYLLKAYRGQLVPESLRFVFTSAKGAHLLDNDSIVNQVWFPNVFHDVLGAICPGSSVEDAMMYSGSIKTGMFKSISMLETCMYNTDLSCFFRYIPKEALILPETYDPIPEELSTTRVQALLTRLKEQPLNLDNSDMYPGMLLLSNYMQVRELRKVGEHEVLAWIRSMNDKAIGLNSGTPLQAYWDTFSYVESDE